MEAEDESSASRQFERRGLTIQTLQEDLAEVPVHVQAEAGALTSLMPRLEIPRPRLDWWRKIDWKNVAWGRVALATLAALLVLSALGWGLSKALADRTYHMRLTGQFHIQTRRKLPADYWKRVYPRLWLPEAGWFINSNGVVFAKGSNKKWKSLSRRAKVTYQAPTEGNYTIDIEVALPAPPTSCTLDFTARSCKRAGKRGTFKIKNNVFECQMPTIFLIPIKSKTKTKTRRTRRRRPVKKP